MSNKSGKLLILSHVQKLQRMQPGVFLVNYFQFGSKCCEQKQGTLIEIVSQPAIARHHIFEVFS